MIPFRPATSADVRIRPPALPATLAVSVLAGCYSPVSLGPVIPEDVSITLSVSGGIAGVQYTIEVDGAARQVRGLACAAFCDFEPGEVLVPISSAQVAALGRRLDDAGVVDLDGRNFGQECCDDFHYELTYRRGERSATVRGGGVRLPRDLADAVGLIHGLVGGVVPALVSPDTRDTDWPRDPYRLGQVDVDGLVLTAHLTYGGGCAQHRMDLVLWGGWMESFPVQINALISHDDSDDPCDAVVTEERSFALLPLREAYEEAYGPIGANRPTVILRLWDPLSASPLGRLVEVVL
jgi:hypothetical protein